MARFPGGRGGSLLEEIGHMLQGLAMLGRSQIGYETRQLGRTVRHRALTQAVCGGKVVPVGTGMGSVDRSHPSTILQNIQRKFAQASGLVSPILPPVDEMSAEEQEFLEKAAMEVGAVLPNKTIIDQQVEGSGPIMEEVYHPTAAEHKQKVVRRGPTIEEVYKPTPTPTPTKRQKQVAGSGSRFEEVYKPTLPKDFVVEVPQPTLSFSTSSSSDGEEVSLGPKSKVSRVPSSRAGRLFNFGMLAVGLGQGAVAEVIRRSVPGQQETKASKTNPFLTPSNVERIVATLCRVRGAALKLGQMLSIQDEGTVPAYLLEIFERVRQRADVMPTYQVERQMESELGADWRSKFARFDDTPFAAASIGQVHRAVSLDGKELAVKVQYPGVADGIDADINNLVSVLNVARIFPKGFFMENFVVVARRELKQECDYEREARAMRAFQKLLVNNSDFYVPRIYDELSTKRVLTTEYVVGKTIDSCVGESQVVRDYVAAKFIELCLHEIFIWRFMQTDPNWSNFLLGRHPETGQPRLVLLDFGASRRYAKVFVDKYMRLIRAAYDQDREKILEYSRDIGFLTGYESKIMEQAHCDSITIIGETLTSPRPFDFAQQNVTQRIHRLIPVMLEHRLSSPPDEIYSLHRKLSGSYLIATKLKAVVSCGPLFDEIYNKYHFGNEDSIDGPLVEFED